MGLERPKLLLLSFALIALSILTSGGAASPWPARAESIALPSLPPDWQVTASIRADVTGDGLPEWALLVWRPWQDWPVQQWSSLPSPIAEFHDAKGYSCHLILLDPVDGREIWAGSALPVPLLALAAEDVDGDGLAEVVALEGDYASGRNGPARHVDVWRWNGFGFTLERRYPAGMWFQRCLSDETGCNIRIR